MSVEMIRTELRRRLLADTILGTDTAFDLIEEIAAIPGVKWSHAPCIGLRGSIGGAVAPTAERIRGADPETDEPFESPLDDRSLRWKEAQEALCPIAIREWHANKIDDMIILACIHTRSLGTRHSKHGGRGFPHPEDRLHHALPHGHVAKRAASGATMCAGRSRPRRTPVVGHRTRAGGVADPAGRVGIPGRAPRRY